MKLSDVAVEKSIFKRPVFFKSMEVSTLFSKSLENFGQISPLIAFQYRNHYHLLDGFKRWDWLRSRGVEDIEISLLPADCDPVEVIGVYLALHQDYFYHSPIPVAFLLKLSKQLTLSKNRIISELLPSLGFEAHQKVFMDLNKLNNLSDEILRFCYEKSFSLKQCRLLAQYDSEIIDGLLKLQNQIHLSASSFLQLAERCSDECRFRDVSFESLVSSEDIQLIITEKTSEHHRTKRLLQRLFERRQPTLTMLQNQLEAKSKNLAFSSTIFLSKT